MLKALPLALALLLGAAPQDSSTKVPATARFAAEAPAGSTARLEVTLTAEKGWHFYGPGDPYEGQAVEFSVKSGAEGLEVGPFVPDRPPHAKKYEFEDNPRMEYEGAVVFTAAVKIPAGTPAGERTVAGVATVTACDVSMCLPAGDSAWSAKLVVTPGTGKADPAPAPPPATAAASEEGKTSFLVLAVIAGLLTIATPCVFPMIPLTVSLLTKRAEKEPEKVVPNALAYAAGMFVSLAGIGLAMSLVFGVAPSDLALSPGFNLVIFGFFLYLALSLFGAYDIQLPAFMTNWAQTKAGTGGGMGLFFMGMVLAFTSFACAAPFAGVLVIEARTSLVKGVIGMSVYAATFTLPFFVTALFPGVLKSLPRSGGWLNAVKVVMGFIEIAAAFKFLRAADLIWEWGVFSRTLVVGIWIACAFGASLYLLGLLVLPHDTKPESIGVTRLLFALAFAAAGFCLLPGLFRRPLPPVVDAFILVSDDEPLLTGSTGGGGKSEDLPWIRNDFDAALREAKATGKPIFVDFTGFG